MSKERARSRSRRRSRSVGRRKSLERSNSMKKKPRNRRSPLSTACCYDPFLLEDCEEMLKDLNAGVRRTIRDSAYDLHCAIGNLDCGPIVGDDTTCTTKSTSTRGRSRSRSSATRSRSQSRHVATRDKKTALPKGVLSEDIYVEVQDRKSTRLNSSHPTTSRMPSSA